MSLFLLEFDRTAKRLVQEPMEFQAVDLDAAMVARDMAQRRVLDEGTNRDVVLLTAPSLEVLKQTHGSFFLTPDDQWERLLNGLALGALIGGAIALALKAGKAAS